MARYPCPITSEYLRILHKHIEASGWHLYDDLHSDFDELQELCEENRPKLVALVQRGFYVVEVLYHVFLPQVSVPRVSPESLRKGSVKAARPTLEELEEGTGVMEEMATWRFSRSHTGLTELITKVRELNEETEVEDIALELDGRVAPAVRSMRANMVTPWREMLSHVEKLAELVRRQLSPEGKILWPSVGSRFALACLSSNQEMSECMNYARTLLAINQENAITPWSQ